ncbi:MAG TPA: protoporphyrinogen oxidase [Micromonosporaceae bacterium]|nr:protoporphyrinogen oxidase [Micromonosporaceae bacterium]HCU49644.1 protoporphyrinogen oxidase [Micromonosporaceae bacterium]
MGRVKRAVVVGGGIAGLAAALHLAESGVKVILLEGSAQLGGKLRTVDGREAGAENFLMRDPAGGPSAAVLLAQELGLGDDIVHPTGVPAGLYLDGALRQLPTGTMLGIPGPQTDLTGVAEIADADVDTGKPVLPQETDVAVGELVRERLGDQVVANLVDPLLGGVYAGRADRLSLAATMPGLHHLLQTEHTLTGAVARVINASRAHSKESGPIFGTVQGGLSRLIEAAAQRLVDLGGDIHYGETVRDLSGLEADGVVLAIPGGKARRLLPPSVAELLGELEYASVGLVTLELPRFELPELSGFLVPEGQGVDIKAATFFSQKWAHLQGSTVLVRASLGRAGSAEVLQRPDGALIELARRDLAAVLGGLPEPSRARVDRWGGGLPQYPPGYLAKVAAAREALAQSKLVLAGAAYDGIGIPACVKSGRNAAEGLVQKWST